MRIYLLLSLLVSLFAIVLAARNSPAEDAPPQSQPTTSILPTLIISTQPSTLPTQPANRPPRPSTQPFHVTLVFRYDDYSTTSDTQIEEGIIDTFKKHHLAITFGVIPAYCATSEPTPDLSQLRAMSGKKQRLLHAAVIHGVVDAELHGLTHQKLYRDPDGLSEFIGLTREQSFSRITTGRALLESYLNVKVPIFIVPWNRYTNETVLAVQDAGFLGFAADATGPCPPDSTLQFLPKTVTVDKVQDAVTYSRTVTDPDLVIICLFHQYDLEDGQQQIFTLSQLDDLLTWATQQPDVRILTLGQLLVADPDLNATRYIHFQDWRFQPAVQQLKGDDRRNVESVYRSDASMIAH